MARTCPFTITAASYLLGALDEWEREEFSRHARMCRLCRREIDELEPVVRLLQAVKKDIAASNGQTG